MGSHQFPFGVDLVNTDIAFVGCDANRIIDFGQFAQFLEIAAGSASEVRAQLYIALDVGYVGRTQFDELFADVSEISGMLTNFMRYLKTTPNKLSHPKTLKPSRSQITKPSNSQTLTLSNP